MDRWQQQDRPRQLDLFDEARLVARGHDAPGKGGTGAGADVARQASTAGERDRALPRYVMEEVVGSENLNRAYKRVKANRGAPGVDGMTVRDLRGWIAENREALIGSLLDGTYRPHPVKGVDIPKPGGGTRRPVHSSRQKMRQASCVWMNALNSNVVRLRRTGYPDGR
jgi:RNA-directed DNA polymerase